jgi:serine/threonine protein kinase/tetratricopeptide (TPR) repeat protein
VTTNTFTSLSVELAHRVDAFESALAADPDTDFARFLPPTGHPLYPAVLGELVRVDQEHAWGRGRPRRLTEYTSRFPVVLEQPGLLGAVAFEEFRQRRRAGEDVQPAEYRLVYGVNVSDWPDIGPGSSRGAVEEEDDLPRTNVVQTPVPAVEKTAAVAVRAPVKPATLECGGESISLWESAAQALPEPGAEFLGFVLLEELGRGAFGRVYLARQGDLAGRPVALKVACDIAAESHTLAQLQHTNIVPVYSLHRAGPFQAACMPYLGRTTLAQVIKSISGRPHLPNSGKELRSTLDVRKQETTVGSDRASTVPAPAVVPVPVLPTGTPAESAVSHSSDPDGWSRLEGLSYVGAVLWLGSQLADGLAHAHARGILHRDLKPANVLLTDEGRPMLLDFNLAEDTKARGAAEKAAVGGTLPYMAPEHIEAFRSGTGKLDERCDLYGLGVILFELLTCRRPFPNHKGSVRDMIVAMLADRRQPPPSLRAYNPAVSPAVDAIVRKCLAADPADRYQRAEDLREDIDRHLSDRPLKFAPNQSIRELVGKWARRHPRLSSSVTVAAVALVVLTGTVAAAAYVREQSRGLEARGRFAEHQVAFRDAQAFLDNPNRSWPQLDVSLNKLRAVIARYGVPESPDAAESWLDSASMRHLPREDRERVKGDIAEAFYLMAQVASLKAYGTTDPAEQTAELDRAAKWNALAGKYGAARLPQAVQAQADELAALRRGPAERPRPGAATPAGSAREHFLAGFRLVAQNRHRAAVPFLCRATQLDPENFSAWFVRGQTHVALHQYDLAALCFGACVSLRPESAEAWMNRGLVMLETNHLDLGKADLDKAIELDPTLAEAYWLRARFYEFREDFRTAADEIGRAIETGNAPVRYYFVRAHFRDRIGDKAGAITDREAGLELPPKDELSWLARSEVRQDRDPAAALADAEKALESNPFSIGALMQKSMLLSEKLKRPADALTVLDRAVELHPDHAPFLAGRGVMLARAGTRDRALRDAKDAIRLETSGSNLYQVGCIYALTAKSHPEDRTEAIRLIFAALRGGFGWQYVDNDPDLDPIRGDEEFRRMVKDAKERTAPKR